MIALLGAMKYLMRHLVGIIPIIVFIIFVVIL